MDNLISQSGDHGIVFQQDPVLRLACSCQLKVHWSHHAQRYHHPQHRQFPGWPSTCSTHQGPSWQSMQQVKPRVVCKVPISGPHASRRPCPSLPQVMASNPLGRVGDSELKVFFLPEETGLMLSSRCRAYAELGTPTFHPTRCDKAAGLYRAEPAHDPPRWLQAPCP